MEEWAGRIKPDGARLMQADSGAEQDWSDENREKDCVLVSFLLP